MEPSEMSAIPHCPSDSGPLGMLLVPQGVELIIRRAASQSPTYVCCCNLGVTAHLKGHKHLCLFQACECHKHVSFSPNKIFLHLIKIHIMYLQTIQFTNAHSCRSLNLGKEDLYTLNQLYCVRLKPTTGDLP